MKKFVAMLLVISFLAVTVTANVGCGDNKGTTPAKDAAAPAAKDKEKDKPAKP